MICAKTAFIGAGYDGSNAVLKYMTTGDPAGVEAAMAATVDKAVASAGFTGTPSMFGMLLLMMPMLLIRLLWFFFCAVHFRSRVVYDHTYCPPFKVTHG